MEVFVRGIGWVSGEKYGCIAQREQNSFPEASGPDRPAEKGFFTYPVKNYGRFDRTSRMTCFSIALALKDAGIGYGPGRKQDIGIVGTNRNGSLDTDLEYFRDYVGSGRTLARGNLFIYTLPSSPLGEAAIHFGFLGPLLYIGGGQRSLELAVETAADMILSHDVPTMTAGTADRQESVFFVLSRENGPDTPGRLSEARTILDACVRVPEIVDSFSRLFREKALSRGDR